MDLFWRYVFAVLLAEVIVELSVSSAFLDRPREALRKWKGGPDDDPTLLGIALFCGFCQSFWAGWAWAFGLELRLPFEVFWPWWVEPIVAGFVVARLATAWHDLLGFLRHRVHRPG